MAIGARRSSTMAKAAVARILVTPTSAGGLSVGAARNAAVLRYAIWEIAGAKTWA